MIRRQFNPAHPGEVLRQFLDIENSTIQKVADHLQVSRVTLSRLLACKAGVSPEMAVKLSQALGTSAELWINMQVNYDLWQARKALGKISIKPLRPATAKSAA